MGEQLGWEESAPGLDMPCDGDSSLVFREGWGSSSNHLCLVSSMPGWVGVHPGLSPQPWELPKPVCKASDPSGRAQHLTCHSITNGGPACRQAAGVAERAGAGIPWSGPELTRGQVQKERGSPSLYPALSQQSSSDGRLTTPVPPTQSDCHRPLAPLGPPSPVTALQPAGLRGFLPGFWGYTEGSGWLCRGDRPDKGG